MLGIEYSTPSRDRSQDGFSGQRLTARCCYAFCGKRDARASVLPITQRESKFPRSVSGTRERPTRKRDACLHHNITPTTRQRRAHLTLMKRKRKACDAPKADKRQRTNGLKHPVAPLLHLYYKEVHSLRAYLVSRLPKSAKKRRRRLLRYGLQPEHDESILVENDVVDLLDSTLVGTSKHVPVQELEQLDQDISAFTQQVSETEISVSPSAGHLRQAEVGFLLPIQSRFTRFLALP